MNWRKLLSFVSKGAEIAAPIIEVKKPGIGKVVELGGKVAEQAAKPKEELKKMKHLILILIAWPMLAQTTATVAETQYMSPIGDEKFFRGIIRMSMPRGCRLTRDGRSFAFTERTYCIGLGPNGAATPAPSSCDETSAEGVVNIKLVPNGNGTRPEGCSYIANTEYKKVDGTTIKDTASWFIDTVGTYQIKDVITTIPSSPTSIVRLSQIVDTTSGTGCLQKNTDGSVTPTGTPCGTGSGGSGIPPANATWSTVTGTWGTNNRPWSSQ